VYWYDRPSEVSTVKTYQTYEDPHALPRTFRCPRKVDLTSIVIIIIIIIVIINEEKIRVTLSHRDVAVALYII